MCSQKCARPGSPAGSWKEPTRTDSAAAANSALGSLIASTRRPLPSVEKAYVRSSDREMRTPDDTLIADSHALVDAIARPGRTARVARENDGGRRLRRQAARARKIFRLPNKQSTRVEPM